GASASILATSSTTFPALFRSCCASGERSKTWEMRAPFSHRSKAPAAAVLFIALCASPATGLEVVLKGVRTPASFVAATIDVRDPLPDRFKKLIDDGGALHLRVEMELWESRPVCDRLVYPAIVRVFRLVRAVSGRGITICDCAWTTRTERTVPNSVD